MNKCMMIFASMGILAVAVAAQEAANVDKESLQGAWTYVAREQGGKRIEATEKEKGELVFTGDRFLDWVPDKNEGTFKLDVTKKPKAIKLTGTGKSEGKDATFAYELKGNTLRLCQAGAGEFPTEIKSVEGSAQFVLEFKRLRKKP